ncbi:MAG: phosphoserine phosphatase [Halobacteriota archaeon]|nr:phosphoserine phosphatase [Halobacteriota archaeon]
MLEGLIEKRDKLIKKADDLREQRDKLNAEANKWSLKRDDLNKKTKESLQEAQKFKELREEYNKKVSESKADRDQLNEKGNKIYAKIDRLREKNNLSKGPSLNELKKEIDRLEFKQQTNVLTPDKERQLVDKISAIKDEFNRKKRELEENEALRTLLEEAQALRDEASEHHEKVVEYVNLAQDYHDKMARAFKDTDKIRAEADDAHKNFISVQENADAAHRTLIRYQKEITDFEQVIGSLKRSNKGAKEHKERVKVKRKAEEIYNQFKQGEKLDTDDLLLLQRSGFL